VSLATWFKEIFFFCLAFLIFSPTGADWTFFFLGMKNLRQSATFFKNSPVSSVGRLIRVLCAKKKTTYCFQAERRKTRKFERMKSKNHTGRLLS
jgi:hypothetical protein